jgi:lauroyl/myristoyl acyltransferase
VGRVARKAVVAGLPLSVLCELARLRGRAYARFGTLPGPIRANLLATFGEGPETDRLARRAYAFSVRSRLRHLMPRLRGFDDPAHWPLIGRERLDEALGQERGAILLTAHLAYASLIGPILRVPGRPGGLEALARDGASTAGKICDDGESIPALRVRANARDGRYAGTG